MPSPIDIKLPSPIRGVPLEPLPMPGGPRPIPIQPIPRPIQPIDIPAPILPDPRDGEIVRPLPVGPGIPFQPIRPIDLDPPILPDPREGRPRGPIVGGMVPGGGGIDYGPGMGG